MQVFAADLFVSKFKDDLLNQHAGLRFRNKVMTNVIFRIADLFVLYWIHCMCMLSCYKPLTSLQVLAPGGSKDSLEIITDYLGREPSLQPFIQSRTRNSLCDIVYNVTIRVFFITVTIEDLMTVEVFFA